MRNMLYIKRKTGFTRVGWITDNTAKTMKLPWRLVFVLVTMVVLHSMVLTTFAAKGKLLIYFIYFEFNLRTISNIIFIGACFICILYAHVFLFKQEAS